MDEKISPKKAQILTAACQVVAEQGVNSLTLEAAAAAANVSKGGLLYHFPNKEALIEGMMQLYLEDLEARIAQWMRTDAHPQQAGAWLRAYVHATFDELESGVSPLIYATLAGIVSQPSLLTRIQARQGAWLAAATADGISESVALWVISATDGAWLGSILNLYTLTATQREQLRAQILHSIQASTQGA